MPLPLHEAARWDRTVLSGSVFARHLAKSPKDLPVIEYPDLEVAGAAKCDRAGMAKGFPKVLRTSYRSAGICAFDGLTGNDAVTGEVEGHSNELDNLSHESAPGSGRLPLYHPGSNVTERGLPRSPGLGFGRPHQCDIRVGTVMLRNISRVTPPSTVSFSREWP